MDIETIISELIQTKDLLEEMVEYIDQIENVESEICTKDEKLSQRVKDHYQGIFKNLSELFD